MVRLKLGLVWFKGPYLAVLRASVPGSVLGDHFRGVPGVQLVSVTCKASALRFMSQSFTVILRCQEKNEEVMLVSPGPPKTQQL